MAIVLLDGLQVVGHNVQPTEPRYQVMTIILVISLFAVSFPGLSKTIPFLKIPHIVFFIGKHFGTGVILATAFIHLLQDSFEALQKPQVKEYFNHVGKYTGLIILASLLSIFLVEYLSTSYVEHLHAEPSQPPTPVSSQSPSPQRSRRSSLKNSPTPAEAIIAIPQTPQIFDSGSQQQPVLPAQSSRTDETTPLLRPPRTQSTPHLNPPPAHANHHAHRTLLPAIVTQDAAGVVPIGVLTNSPRIIKMRGCACLVDHVCVCPASAFNTHPHTPLIKDTTSREPSRSRQAIVANIVEPLPALTEVEREAKPAIGRRRQVVGLLVLQLGIMIHSIVIGLTLAITTGADFTSLTTAVVFHQLFEGLSLGIRIAALPPLPSSKDDEILLEAEDTNKPGVHRSRGVFRRILMKIGGERGERWLKCSLALLFAITTPVGIGLGMIAFEVRKQKEGIELARMYLIQGLMSAISAGMLIYVSTVEMIAGDFVFGDVEGHSHHGHSHDLPSAGDEEHALPDQAKSPSSRSDDTAADSNQEPTEPENEPHGVEADEDHYHHHHHHHHGKIGKKVLAVLSLLAGVGGMVLVGLGE
ncbi:hypothetical protein D9756_010240 [Leucocoprinus leucothites]|uniref:Zinc/iron permease n=1 Tax=Leucocoprinus leucothites TaxID=201217 RepID=A0A8H5FT60_9AGAR|nr:hypothetical protein D9756_010240 [Leucoagaricus leucothites]